MTGAARIYRDGRLQSGRPAEELCGCCGQPLPDASLAINKRRARVLVPLRDVTAFVAGDKIVEVFTRSGSAGVIDRTLDDLERRFPGRWTRLRHSALVLLSAVERITYVDGTATAIVPGAGDVKISRRHWRRMRDDLDLRVLWDTRSGVAPRRRRAQVASSAPSTTSAR